MKPQTKSEINKNVRHYLNGEFGEREEIGFFSKSGNKVYHNGKQLYGCINCYAPKPEDCVCRREPSDGEAWSGGFTDNH